MGLSGKTGENQHISWYTDEVYDTPGGRLTLWLLHGGAHTPSYANLWVSLSVTGHLSSN